MRSVRIQKCPGKVYDLFSPPGEYQSGLLRHNSHFHSFQIFLGCIVQENIRIFRVHYHCHPFLRLGNSQFRTVQTCIFFRHLVQIYDETICQLPDRHGNAAGSEIVAFLNQSAHFFPPKESLYFSFCRCIALLDFRTACLYGTFRMYFGGACSTSTAISAGSASQQNDDVSRIRRLPDDIASGRSAHNSTDLHPLRHIGRMIDLFYITGGQTDLISIGRITARRTSYKLFLRKLSTQCLLSRHGRIRRAGNTHCLIHIRPP